MDYLDVNVDLLDRQVVDSEDVPLCKVDDLRFERGEDGRWRVSEILVGPGALGDRFQGRLGAVLTGIHRRHARLVRAAAPRHRVAQRAASGFRRAAVGAPRWSVVGFGPAGAVVA
ncbi:MAG: hypothetical protein V9G10_03210 [Candidatus Nanopelagicales bacterium]